MSNISFVIFTFNEEKRIEAAIRNFINYGPVIIMDGGSTDATQEISEWLGAKFVLRPKTDKLFVENAENYEVVLANVTTDWIYWGYADNLAPLSLIRKLVALSQQTKYKYVIVPLYTYLWGETKQPALKGAMPCIFMKQFLDFNNNHIHGMGRFLGRSDEILSLPNQDEFALRHFSLYDLNKFVMGHLRYAQAEADFKFESGNKFSLLKLGRGMVGYFLMYIRGGYKNGTRGLLVSLAYAFFRFLVYFRLFELENNLTLESIEAEYQKEKNKIISNLN